MPENPPLEFTYTNHRGETNHRRVIEPELRYGVTQWHPEPQWLMQAFDVEKQAYRSFALRDCRFDADVGSGFGGDPRA